MKIAPLVSLAALALILLCPPIVCAQALPSALGESPAPQGLGTNIHFTDPRPGELEALSAAGFRWVRMDFGWGSIERTKGVYDFAPYDRLIASLEAQRLHAYFILDYSNANYDENLSPHTDAGREAFARWAAASVRHFKGHGILWEMYNEPNIKFWRPKPNVEDYAKLAITVGKALREAEPQETYVGPATSLIDLPFIEACCKAGCLEYWSAVSVHPYRQTDPETVAGEYRKLRALIGRYAPKGKNIPILSGEWGYSSAWKNFDEDRQANVLARQWLTNLSNEIPVSIWYDWHEDGVDPKEAEHHFGTVRFDYHQDASPVYEPKPAYLAAKRLTEQLDGFSFSKRLWTGKPDEYLLLFTKQDQQKLVAWKVNPRPGDVIAMRGLDSKHFTWQNYSERFAPTAASFENGVVVDPPMAAPLYLTPKDRNDLLAVAATWSRVPLELTVTAPTLAKVATTVRNPLDHPITLVTAEGNVKLEPGETRTLAAQQPIMRTEFGAVVAELEVQGLGKLAQRTDVVVENPLTVFMLPREGTARTAIIQNPSGEAFRATALLTGAGPTPVADVAFAAGEKQKSVMFALPENWNEDRAGLTLLGERDQPIFDIQPARYVPLPTLQPDAKEPAWGLSTDGDANVESHVASALADPADGPIAPGLHCLKIDYDFAKGWKFLQLRAAAHGGWPIDGKPQSLSLWVFGDGKRNLIRMRFVDAKGQTFQPDAERMTWTGWRRITFPLDGRSSSHWGGPDDGVVHYPIHLDTLFLLDSFNRRATSGTFYVSTPLLIYE